MARTATLTGRVAISPVSGLRPLISKPIASETPTIDKQIESETIIAASATVTLNLGGITKATLVDVSFTDASTGAPKQTTVLVTEAPSGSEVSLPKSTRFTLIGFDAAAGLKLLRVTAGSGNNTIAKLVAAGT